MTTLFVGGHGRCNETIPCPVPQGVTISWFGDLGKPVSKRMSSAILRGQLTRMTGLSSAAYPPCEHYSCESVALESEFRARAFLAGPWDNAAYLLQARPDFQVPLSLILAYAVQRWGGGGLQVKWAVCRSSVVYSQLNGHDYGGNNNVIDRPRESSRPAPAPGARLINDVAGALFIQQWGAPLLNYGQVSASQVQATFGKAATSSGGYVLV
jgi:hypothetical protein